MKRTPLFTVHQKLGGRLIEFGGWEMPVQYSSITDEHLAVRNAAGLFDISHMGEVVVTGSAAPDFLNFLLTNNVCKLKTGQGQYTLMCNEGGGVVDDLYAYCVGENDFLLIVNASRIDDDVAWMQRKWATFARRDEVHIKNVSEQLGAIAVQGPKVVEFIGQVIPGKALSPFAPLAVADLKKNEIGKFGFDGGYVYVGRTGYTGEDGFEIIAEVELLIPLWHHLMKAGEPAGLKPCGLGARDTLRTEVCYPLYGHELDEVTTPVEAGVGFFVAMDKGEFIGRPVLAEQKANGTKKKLIAFKMTDKSAPPRPHYPIWSSGTEATKIGDVVSGTQSPTMGIGIGLGYVPPDFAKPGTPIEIEIRGKRSAAVVVKKPIYQKTVS